MCVMCVYIYIYIYICVCVLLLVIYVYREYDKLEILSFCSVNFLIVLGNDMYHCSIDDDNVIF